MVQQLPSTGVAPLPRQISMAIVTALLVCAAAAWLFTIGQANSMAIGGVAMMGAGLFLITWLLMMIAMMFPAVVPMVLAHATVVRSRGEGTIPTAAFIVGYLVVWAAAGLVPLAVIQLMGSPLAAPLGAWRPQLGGAVIVIAGIYQLTPLKNACLKACRSGLGFIITHDFGGGSRSAARAGMSHGLYCLGCCWALMAVLAVVGLMNLVFMAVFGVVFFVEKNSPHGVVLSRIFGAATVFLGVALMAHPDILYLVGGSMA